MRTRLRKAPLPPTQKMLIKSVRRDIRRLTETVQSIGQATQKKRT